MNKNKTWNKKTKSLEITPKEMSDFLNEINEVCMKYGLSISHEDRHGSFIVELYDKKNILWLKDAMKNY